MNRHFVTDRRLSILYTNKKNLVFNLKCNYYILNETATPDW